MTARTITICILLFLSSALISISIRKAQSEGRPRPTWHDLSFQHEQPRKYAFATFLSAETEPDGPMEEPPPLEPAETDGYFLSARMLAYQLLHSPTTRTNTSIPFIILVTPSVTEHKRARLRADGATIIPVELIESDWIKPDVKRWAEVLTKLRLFQQTQYDKICFIDADHLVYDRLDGIFDDPTTEVRKTNDSKEALHDYEGDLPETYAFAAGPDLGSYEHHIPDPFEVVPEAQSEWEWFNSGFFVFQPLQTIFEYYVSLLVEQNRDKLHDATFPDQHVLNYAHRPEGNMPWRKLTWGWNVNWGTRRDLDAGARSVHAAFWLSFPSDDQLLPDWQRVRSEMRAYYRGWDDRAGGVTGSAELV